MSIAFNQLFALSRSICNSPNQYALLLGSGISRAAGIPTGWEVTLDLLRNFVPDSKALGESELVKAYFDLAGVVPNYSDLMDKVTSSPAERQALMRKYFEPTDEEREQGLKEPTIAHSSIAVLVKMGLIKLIVTTNFDRLLEKALERIGVVPNVISQPSDLDGAPNVAHANCIIIKLHGDYLDTRIRNTQAELAEYSPEISDCLCSYLEYHHLIISGWSGEYDPCLCRIIQEVKTRQYAGYWLGVGTVNHIASKIIDARQLKYIEINNADDAFSLMVHFCESETQKTEDYSELDSSALVSLTKRLIVSSEGQIVLHDLLTDASLELNGYFLSEKYNIPYNAKGADILKSVMMMKNDSDSCMSIMATLALHGGAKYLQNNLRAFEAICERPASNQSGHSDDLKYYSAWLIYHVIGAIYILSNNIKEATS